ncbi:hypothetical protein CfE428DRAFT_5503 [Chthoniobacter flavus Ellin428]|uniref:Superinfection immunity protein n=1 Tax=Chthoniobacter flavus Ellin428 TaxID=497964 RepID=B4D9B3_9BACT|nr:superinfection immunity protein [Chthoniobacter flavus]EDY17016.1 hypothetical protein CfE428DRAFT_5503 [Chthoniobacter flavus Ellin428]TCO86101.1 T4 superinfection immunity protein [Chthoniobacter flavus]
MQAADVYPGSGVGALSLRAAWRWLRLAAVMLLGWQLVTGVGWALDIVTADGHLYKNCTITEVEPGAIRIIYADGAAQILYEDLPPALQKQYFDPAKVMEARKQAADARHVAEARAEEDRRQRQIAAAQAAAQAEAQRAREAEVHQREERVRQRQDDEKKALALKEAVKRAMAKHRITMFGLGLMALGALLALFVYFLPTIIGRHKGNAVAIFAFNLFLGWTLIGWVCALVWACTEDSAMERLARERLNAPPQPTTPPQPYQAQGGPQLPQGGVRRLDQGGRYIEEQGGRYIENGGRYLE